MRDCHGSAPRRRGRVPVSLTLEEIAKLAGVSRSTVSRVVNDHPNVREQVRERVDILMTHLNAIGSPLSDTLLLDHSQAIDQAVTIVIA